MSGATLRRLAVVALVLAGAGWWGGAATAQPDRDRPYSVQMHLTPSDAVGVAEAVRLEIRIDTTNQQLYPEPTFELDNFRILSGPSQSTNFQMVNGRISTSYALIWRLQPKEVGTARVYNAWAKVGDDRVDLEEVSVEVLAESPARRRPVDQDADPLDRFRSRSPFDELFDRQRRPPPPRREPEIFLRAEVTPRRPWVGQQVLYTLYLYTQADIHSVNPTDIPDFAGFWAHVVPQPDQLQPTMVEEGGQRYGKVVLLQRALFPRRAGRFELPPVTARMTARLPDDSPFGLLMPRAREIGRESQIVTVDVRPLPEPQPATFTGAVGDLELAAELEPRQIEVGGAATLTVALEGQGHVQGIAAPGLDLGDAVEVFPPQQEGEDELRRGVLYGRRTWSYVLVPSRPGTIELPPVEIATFDPRAGEYRTLASEPLVLVVRGQTRIATEDGQTVELHSIRTAALPAAESDLARRLEPWLFLLPWGAGALLFVLRRDRRGGAQARRHLVARLDEAAAETRPRQAAALVEEGWRDYLGERWGIPRGTPSPQWAAQLEAKGVRRELAEELVRLADEIHYLRYAPKLSSTEEIQRELIDRSRRLLRRAA